jgi:sec-independent protein translocase protein TatB
MFNIGWSEIVVIGVVALIVIGPKELPGVLRTVGQMMGKVRRMASEFQGQFNEALREAEMVDLKKEVENITATATEFTHIDPMADVQRDIEKTFEDKPLEPLSTTGETGGAVATPTAETLPAVNIDVPLPEPLPPVTADDFAPAKEPVAVERPAEPAAKKQAGSA